MRIGILGTTWPYRGGLTAFNERLARQFAAEGNEVEIFTFTMQYPDFLFPGKTQYSDTPKPADLSITRTMNSINPFTWIRTARAIRKAGIELLVIKFWIPLMAPCLGTIARLCRRKGIRVVSILDNVIPHEPHFWDKWLIRYFIGSVDRFIAMSESVQKDCRMFLPAQRHDAVAFNPHPLYDNFGQAVSKAEARQHLNLPEDKTILLFFGFIRDYKGLDLLIDAFGDPTLQDLGAKLIVAGEFYGDPKPYHNQIARLDIGSRVALHTDFIPDHEVNRYFCAADLVVQPYKSATQSGVTQIAFHFGKPMVVTNVGGLAEIVPDGKVGFVVEPEAQQIADAIVRYFEEDWQERLTAGVMEEKKKYAWENMTGAIGKL